MNSTRQSAIEKQAKKELEEEAFREAVDAAKIRMCQRKPLLRKLFPWKIVIMKETSDV